MDAESSACCDLRAIEDALRAFPADEIVLVTRPDDQAGWLEEGIGDKARARISLPVTRVTVDEGGTMTTSAGSRPADC